MCTHLINLIQMQTKPSEQYFGLKKNNNVFFPKEFYLFKILYLILQNNAIGAIGLCPGKGDAVLPCVSFPHHTDRGGCWKHRNINIQFEGPNTLHKHHMWLDKRKCSVFRILEIEITKICNSCIIP